MSSLVMVLGFGALVGVMALFTPAYGNGKDVPIEGAVLMALCTGLLVIGLLLGFVFFNKKADITLVRWTKKSFLILATLVLTGTILAVQYIVKAYSNNNGNNANVGTLVVGNQGYVEDVELDTQKLLDLTNKARVANGKTVLEMNEKLNTSALSKCEDMVADNYWSHEDKDGIEPWHFITETGYEYSNSGENLAYGFINETGVVDGWMDSEGHRANILGDYTQVGFATCKAENYMGQGKQLVVVQHFATPYSTPVQSDQQSQSAPTTYVSKSYVAPVCTKTAIPYETIYKEVNYLYVGETDSFGGYEGYIQTCTADSTGYKPLDFTVPPVAKYIYQGTMPLPADTAITEEPGD